MPDTATVHPTSGTLPHPCPLVWKWTVPRMLCQAAAGRGRGALTNVLHGEPSVRGHVDEEDHLPRVPLEGDVLFPVDGEGPVVIDCATHIAVAVHLEDSRAGHMGGCSGLGTRHLPAPQRGAPREVWGCPHQGVFLPGLSLVPCSHGWALGCGGARCMGIDPTMHPPTSPPVLPAPHLAGRRLMAPRPGQETAG